MGEPEAVSAENAGRTRARSRRRASRRTVVHRAAIVLLGVGLAVGIAGCAAEPTIDTSPYVPTSIFEDGLQQARDYGASDHQIDVLERAMSAGQLDFEDFNVLIGETFDCFDAAGIEYVYHGPMESFPGSGLLMPNYEVVVSTSLDAGSFSALYNDCTYRYSEFANMVYQMQPVADESDMAAIRSQLPSILTCLRENGAEVDDDAPFDVIRGAAIEVYAETDAVGDPVACMEGL